MSQIEGIIRKPGIRAAVYVGTETESADGNTYMAAPWTERGSNVPVNIQQPTAERVAQLFGTGYPVEAIGYALPDAFVEGDRFLVTAGPFLTERYEVTKRVRHRQGSGNDHDELALDTTDEVFP